jgi:small subunit ribosomal protein S6
MRHYEVTFIVDPVLSGDEIKSTAHTYVDLIKSEDCQITHVDETGLRPLAYPINKRHSGIYFTIEFSSETGSLIDRLELALRRDERIMRFLTVALDKFGVKYNDDKRNGLIGKGRKDKFKADAAPVVAAPVAAAPVADAIVAAPIAADPLPAPEPVPPVIESSEEE